MSQINSMKNHSYRLLDLVITNSKSVCDVLQDEEPLVSIDPHHPGLIEHLSPVHAVIRNFSSTAKRYDFENINRQKFCQLLSAVKWDQQINVIDDVEQASVILNDIMKNIIPKCVPISRCSSRKYPLWYSPDTIRKIEEKTHPLKIYREHKDLLDVFFE
ncbi:hypothetical protein JTB14_031007 [Gonioctena quinquepunctata]|nr:hypothetical protein JTB14_031007 [Gonioctena quinquepunctata]